MDNWINIAERLRVVKQAHEDYLFREFVDRLIIGPMLLDRLAEDLGGFGSRGSGPGKTSMQDMTRMADDDR